MGGGTLQLVAYGGQDIHIIGNPEISFFKSVYRRHTNFAVECIKQNMLGPVISEEFKASFKLGRDGDLINKMHLYIKLPEQKNLLLTAGGREGDAPRQPATLKKNTLSSIDIINPGTGYIYGATASINGPPNAFTDPIVITDSNNRISQILLQDFSTFDGDSYSISITIIGNRDPSNNSPMSPIYGSGAEARINVNAHNVGNYGLSTDGGNRIEYNGVEAKYYRNPKASIIPSGDFTIIRQPKLDVNIDHNNGKINDIKIIEGGRFTSNADPSPETIVVDIAINDYYNDSSDNILDIMADPYTRNKHWISYQNQPAYSYIKDIELKIGEQLIDKHTGQYYDIYDELYEDDHKNMDYMTGKDRKIGQWPPKDKVFGNKYTLVPKEIELFVPLKFWFNKGIEQSLPIIALQYHDVTIDITFRDLRSILIWHPGEYTGTGADDAGVSRASIHHINFTADERRKINNRKLIKPEIELWANYIYLDTDERKRFAKSSHEYLIEQVQIIHDRYKETVDIPFNHSVKSLFWVIQNKNCFKEDTKFQNNRHELSNDTVSGNWQNQKIEVLVDGELEEENDYTIISNYHNGFTQNNNYLFYNSHQDNVNLSYLNYLEKPEHFKRCKIIMNGVDRIEFKPSTYFRTIQPHECKLNIPQKNIHMYSFSLEPKKFQPTGSCNFSKLDSVQLKFDGGQNYANYDIFVYAHNYNILRIMEGMSGILYNS